MTEIHEAERLLHTVFARSLRKPFRKAIEEYRLLRPGDRVAACISGGKDSMLLAMLLRDLSRELPFEPGDFHRISHRGSLLIYVVGIISLYL